MVYAYQQFLYHIRLGEVPEAVFPAGLTGPGKRDTIPKVSTPDAASEAAIETRRID